MNAVSSVSAAPAAAAPLTADQKTALSHLHSASQQLEGVFLGMMFKAMRDTVPADSLYGNSNAQQMFTSMLGDQRATSMAQTGSLGIGKLIEGQLRSSVLSDASSEAKTRVLTGVSL